MDRYLDKFRTASSRLKGYDYGSSGIYFVTICTKNHLHYFGEIKSNFVETHNYAPQILNWDHVDETHNNASLRVHFLYSVIGEKAIEFWKQIPQHFPFVELDEYIVMPDHIHGMIRINKPEQIGWYPNKFEPQAQNLASIIRGFKSSLKKYATQNLIDFEWQSRYYDEIIRTEEAFNNIRSYIQNNPEKWCAKD